MKMKQGIDFCHLEPLTHVKKMKDDGELLKERESIINCILEDSLRCETLEAVGLQYLDVAITQQSSSSHPVGRDPFGG